MPFQKGHGYIGGGSKKGVRNSPKTEFKKGVQSSTRPFIIDMVPWNKGKKLSPEHIKHLSETHKGISAWNKGKKYTDEEKKRLNLEGLKKGAGWNKGKHNIWQLGEKHHNWKGGTTTISHKIRSSLEYKLWRRAVFERDDYTCIWCRKRKEVSGRLEADHIKPFSLYPELRFAIDNGRTLCKDCHKTTDTYPNNLH